MVFDQRTTTWLELHQAAFACFGGLPSVIALDNLKAAVIRAAFDVSGLRARAARLICRTDRDTPNSDPRAGANDWISLPDLQWIHEGDRWH